MGERKMETPNDYELLRGISDGVSIRAPDGRFAHLSSTRLEQLLDEQN